MKTRLLVVLAVLVLGISSLSACDLFGKSDAERQQEYYQQQIEAYNQAREIRQQQQEEFNRQLEEALEEWVEATYGN